MRYAVTHPIYNLIKSKIQLAISLHTVYNVCMYTLDRGSRGQSISHMRHTDIVHAISAIIREQHSNTPPSTGHPIHTLTLAGPTSKGSRKKVTTLCVPPHGPNILHLIMPCGKT